jgi:hypothetical protein
MTKFSSLSADTGNSETMVHSKKYIGVIQIIRDTFLGGGGGVRDRITKYHKESERSN